MKKKKRLSKLYKKLGKDLFSQLSSKQRNFMIRTMGVIYISDKGIFVNKIYD